MTLTPNNAPRAPAFAMPAAWTWPQFWAWANDQLRAAGYRNSTRKHYRQVLRSFHRFCKQVRQAETDEFPFAYPIDAPCAPTPDQITQDHIRAYLNHLGDRNLSASWIGMNTSVLRTLFDRLGGRTLTAQLRGPRHARHLPRTLSHDDVRTLLAHAQSARDRLLLSLLYGCGLKVGEAVRLRWEHIDEQARHLNMPATPCLPARTIPLPRRLQAQLTEERTWHPRGAFLLPGRCPSTHLSIRSANRIVRQCVHRAGLNPTVSAMTLRHSFARHALEHGIHPRALQELLGHRSIETTLVYQRCLLPKDAASPLDQTDLPSLSPPTASNTRTRLGSKPPPLSSLALARNRIDQLTPETQNPAHPSFAPPAPDAQTSEPPSTTTPGRPTYSFAMWISKLPWRTKRGRSRPPD